MKIGYLIKPLLILCIGTGLTIPAQGQTTAQTSFGKNRVQYHHQFDDWLLYETPNFITYWYGDARNVAQAALQIAELDYPQVHQLLEHQMTEKIEMLVFSDLTDLKQSNIGEEEVFGLRSGETKVIGNKVFVYFDGSHTHLRAQIREGIAGVLINSMLFGANFQEIVQNAVLLNLPGWYTEGLSAYCGEAWNPELDNELKDILLHKDYPKFDKLAKEYPRLAGHAFWYYISLHFGQGTVSNLLYLTRINRSVDAGFLYVMGAGYRRTTTAMMEYFYKRYRDEAEWMEQLPQKGKINIRNKRKLPLYQFKISPDGKKIAWVSNHIGKWNVWVQELKSGKRKRILKGGARNALQAADYNYPLLAWSADNRDLAVLYERRDIVNLALIDLKSGKKKVEIFSPEFQRAFSMDFISPNEIILSAAVKGFTDLFVYRLSNRQTERITQDFWDDLDASVANIDGKKGILFVSNRLSDTLSFQKMDTILPLGRFDVFFYDWSARSPELVRISQTPMSDERSPVMVDSAHFAFLGDGSGIFNRYVGYMEPFVAYHEAVIYLKDNAEVRALDDKNPGEWPAVRILPFLAPLDTVLLNIDSTQIDSIRFFPVYKKRAKSWRQTTFDRNISSLHASPRSGKWLQTTVRNRQTQCSVGTVDAAAAGDGGLSRFREIQLREAGLPISNDSIAAGNTNKVPTNEDKILPRKPDSIAVIQPGWLFQLPDHLNTPPPNSRPEPENPERQVTAEPFPEIDSVPMFPRRNLRPVGLKQIMQFGQNGEVLRFIPSRIVPYRLRFRTDFIATSIDNNLLFEGLDSYAGSPAGYRTPPPGVLLRANFKDLLEDYVVEAGFRLPTSFDGAEYYLWFDNKKKRLDKRIALYRRTVVNSLDPGNPGALPLPYQVRTNTVLGQYEVRYPLDAFFSLRARATVRQDKRIFLSSNRATLEEPDYAEQRAALRLSAVYDNSVDVDLNIKIGTRARFFIEAVKRFDFNTQPNWSLRLNQGFMTVIGLDARHYQPIDRRSILAVRLAAGTSFGSEKMLYYLGGVDNWLYFLNGADMSNWFNQQIPIPQDESYAFQTLAANLRGFKMNIRNGNSFALLNAELRVPVFKYLSKKPVIGNFWRNFQIIGFFDVGTAWHGKSPYRGDNPINQVFLTNGPVNQPPVVTMVVNYFRDPLVAGYGAGMRAQIFGMYLRLDYAWGIETRKVQDPRFYVSLGTDF